MYPFPDTPVQGLGSPDGPDPRDEERLYSHPPKEMGNFNLQWKIDHECNHE